MGIGKKYKIGLVIGRFQPFHLGHLYLLKKALLYADKIIIAIGSSNIKNSNNPLSFALRKKMLEKVIQKEKLGDKVLKIISSPDNPNDDIWANLLIKKTGHFDVKIGKHNDSTNDVLARLGYKVLKIAHFKRDLYEGRKIRRLFRIKKAWEDRIPAYLVDLINKVFA